LAVGERSRVDTFIVTIEEELAERIIAAGLEHYLRRSLHRSSKDPESLDAQSERAE
jgi:hypothetical protein